MASSQSSFSMPIPIFDGSNYDFWSLKMKTFFLAQDLWKNVTEGFGITEDTSNFTKAQHKKLKDDKQKDARALFVIQQALADSIFPRIIGSINAK